MLLQVLSRDGSWLPVAPAADEVVVLVGHTLSFMTAGRLQAASHRIVSPPDTTAGVNGCSARLSLCFKLRAADDVVLSPQEVTGARVEQLPLRCVCMKWNNNCMLERSDTVISW